MALDAAGDGRDRQACVRLANERGGGRGSRRMQGDHRGGSDATAAVIVIAAATE